MIDCLHEHGENPCGGVAFRVLVRPVIGTAIVVNGVVLLDGTQPGVGTAMVCGTCGRSIGPGNIVPEGGYA